MKRNKKLRKELNEKLWDQMEQEAEDAIARGFASQQILHPIRTVGQPGGITLPPCALESPTLAAGCPPISTDEEPEAIISGGPAQVAWSPARAAGAPPMSTMAGPLQSDHRHEASAHRTSGRCAYRLFVRRVVPHFSL